jgi:hypothetical protein
MGEEVELISKKLSEEPIKVPQNPFWIVFKRFGRDEALAGIINIISTIIVGIFTSIPIFLALAGPVLEKLGFFPANFFEARNIYKTTPKHQRKSQSYYFKLALKNSTKSLTEDILIHDPLYIFFMFFGLILYPAAPVWLLAATSFIVAVIIVAFIEVAYVELNYIRFKQKLKRAGFESEGYYETRFFISSQESQKELLEKISKEFNLYETGTKRYHDRYFSNNLEEYSGRTSKVRLRMRDNPPRKKSMKTLQIVYTRARETATNKFDQYRFFPIRKDKFYHLLDGKMPLSIPEIKNPKARKILKYSQKVPPQKIEFERTFARNDNLLITLDKVSHGRKYYLLEVKVRKDTKTLIAAMRYIMQEFPVVQTTKGKFELRY